MSTIFTRARVPPDLERAWLQHLRDFDVANPGCHFEVIADAPEITLTEMVEMLRINPALSVMQIIEREPPSERLTRERLIRRIIVMLPDDKAEGLDILDTARRMVVRFKR